MPRAQYFASYGTHQIACVTLRDARKATRLLANSVKYDINIVRAGDVVEVVRYRRPRKVRKVATYTTSGSVRGGCGHRHRSLRTAVACFLRDCSGCSSQGGYSDRSVHRSDGEDLTEDEMREIDALTDGESS